MILLCITDHMETPLYSTMSGIDGSAMYQLRNLINRRNVVKDPYSNFAAFEDFIPEVSIAAAVMTVFGMDDNPSLEMFKGQLKWKFHFLFYCFNILI